MIGIMVLPFETSEQVAEAEYGSVEHLVSAPGCRWPEMNDQGMLFDPSGVLLKVSE